VRISITTVFNKAEIDGLYRMLAYDEGVRFTPYDDFTGLAVEAPKGNLTIGIGRNLKVSPLSKEVVYMIFLEDLMRAYQGVIGIIGIATYKKLTFNRRAALINLCFNLGPIGLSKFKKMLHCVEMHDYVNAGKELRASKWAKQVDPLGRQGIGRDDRVFNLLVNDYDQYAFL